MNLRNLITAIALMGCGLAITHAQQTLSRSSETGLALEVVFLPGEPPAYQPLSLSPSRKGGTWYGRFGRIAGWQLPQGALPIDAVRIVPHIEGEVVRINVSVLRAKFHDAENMVATYSAREGEQITVTPLESYGVQPFEIKVIRVAPTTSNFPLIINQTKSVEVVGIEPLIATFPRYKLTLHNLADKNIAALSVQIRSTGKTEMSGLPFGRDGEPLIKAREFGELVEPLATRAQPSPAGYTPSLPPAQQIVITSLVFEDGSYEGEVGPAARYRAFVMGDRIELSRVVPVLESFLAATDTGSASPEKLRLQLESLSCDVDEGDVAGLAKAFPSIERERVRSASEAATHGIKRDLLDRLQGFQDGAATSASDFHSWLNATRDRYVNWLSRVKTEGIPQP
jgi:hypothetical protein